MIIGNHFIWDAFVNTLCFDKWPAKRDNRQEKGYTKNDEKPAMF
jgi:hypothetical protein